MKFQFVFLLILVLSGCLPTTERNTFEEKIAFPKELYAHEQTELFSKLSDLKVKSNELEILLQGFKAEERLELWVKNRSDQAFQLFKNYDFCTSSGTLGPKRKEGDRQIPEGVYHIDRFNPNSSYFLSLGLNYPNASDKIRGHATQPGSDIFIHGKCVTVGCIPITDEWIRELYFLAETAKANGQSKIPVLLFPFEMTKTNLKRYRRNMPVHQEFWEELEPFAQYFDTNHQLPSWQINREGAYVMQ